MDISHPDKILFPKDKITKQDLANYYASVSKLILPHIKNRPISMKRYPNGISKQGFFQKNAPKTLPSTIKTATITHKDKTKSKMILCNDQKTLLWLANQNCITPHIWLSTMNHPHCPDRMVFDLDPPVRKGFKTVAQAAFMLKEALEKTFKLTAFVTTTGSKGVHVVVPLKPVHPFDQVRAFARMVAEHLVEYDPKTFTLEHRKNKRKGRLYLDVLRNGEKQTVMAPYSVRPLNGAPIATPISWDELKKLDRSDAYLLHTFSKRLKKNPWAGMDRHAKTLVF